MHSSYALLQQACFVVDVLHGVLGKHDIKRMRSKLLGSHICNLKRHVAVQQRVGTLQGTQHHVHAEVDRMHIHATLPCHVQGPATHTAAHVQHPLVPGQLQHADELARGVQAARGDETGSIGTLVPKDLVTGVLAGIQLCPGG